jgi:hypothetical protein
MIMFGETITHTGALETLNVIMIMLGFNTVRNTIIDYKEISRAVGNHTFLLLQTNSSQRGNKEIQPREGI